MVDYKYYIAQVPKGDQYPFLKIDKGSLPILEKGLLNVANAQPLKFRNAWREDNVEEGVSEERGEILFSGSQALVSDNIKDQFLKWSDEKNIPLPVSFYPAIYIDDADNWHETYWYINLKNFIDCWDREKSEYRIVPTEHAPLFHIQRFVIDREKLDESKPESLMFKIDNNVKPPLVLREELCQFFEVPGVELIEVG
jgi:hypothetical protein